MRQTIRDQLTLGPPLRVLPFPKAREYEEISAILDECPEAVELVLTDLLAGGVDPSVGRIGMSAEQVLRAKIVKQREGFSYEDLAFQVTANEAYRTFCRLGAWESWSRSTLHRNLSRVGAPCLEQINRLVLGVAERDGFEDGSRVATDATALTTNIHAPTDSALLMDVIRVCIRLQVLAAENFVDVAFDDVGADAARLHWRISSARRKAQRLPYYEELLAITKKVLERNTKLVEQLESVISADLRDGAWAVADALRQVDTLGQRVFAQAWSRVIEGKPVPAKSKVLSIFEPHTDLIVQGNSMTFGHKITLTTGASGLTLDVVVERGNPGDCTLAIRMLERQRALYGRAPVQAVFDGGYSSRANLESAKTLGVRDVVFSKHPGLSVDDMADSWETFEELRCFRTGVERVISLLKRNFGLGHCDWCGFEGFESYVWTSVLSGNLVVLARLRLTRKRVHE
ncbi:MAG: ISNCY family transposase [Rhodobacteraceae bacterium]|nr:ISNCY family transposase [Paracoccaceae bacterium]